MAQTRPGQEVICDRDGHVYSYEMASMCALGGVLPRIVNGEDGILSWAAIAQAIRPNIYYRPKTALIALENTHNMAGGTVYPAEVADEICDRAHEAGLPVHLDGARIFNAATYLGRPVHEITSKFDSIQFCLSKGLGAPVGSMIVGSREFIERSRSVRKMLGGGMRQVGVLAAAGLVALEEGPKRLSIDHDNARWLAAQLAETPGISVNAAKVQTNIVIFSVKKSGTSSAEFLKKLADKRVLAVPVDAERVRMVTHLDVSRADIEQAAGIVRSVMTEK
jgi:threonine aldolase